MAKEAEQKVAIAKRLHDFACNRSACRHRDLLIDPLTFTICTGNEDDRKLGLWTLEGIERIRAELPDVPDHPRPVEHLLRPQPGRRATC